MSRTDKDRPYWVRLNDDATSTWHDHLHLGEDVYRTRVVRDAQGQPVTEQVPRSMSATDIVKSHFGYFDRNYFLSFGRISEKIFQLARELHGAGRGDEQIIYGYDTRYVRERYLAYTIADHCTEGEPVKAGQQYYWSGSQPCIPEIRGLTRYDYTWSMSNKKHHFSRARYSHERAVARDTLGGVVRAYNSGYDVEDWDEDTYLTAQHRHSMDWDLY